jgi:hypothetical protein
LRVFVCDELNAYAVRVRISFAFRDGTTSFNCVCRAEETRNTRWLQPNKQGVNIMRLGMILSVTTLALSTAFIALPASAQNGGRAMNDGGYAPSQSGVAQYNSTGQVVGTGPGYNAGYAGHNEANGGCARFHSFDPATGTILGRDGRRHPCQ